MTESFSCSVVIPIFNEEENIHELYRRLVDVFGEVDVDYNLIFVDDGSEDDSLNLLRELREKDKNVKIISFSKNFGHQSALSAGISYSEGDFIVTMDGDLQDPPEVIPEMIEKWQEDNEVVYGFRKASKSRGFGYRIVSSLFYKTLSLVSTEEIPEGVGDFRLIDRRIAEIIKNLPERNRVLRGLVSWAGFSQTQVEYERQERERGESDYSLQQSMDLALEALTSFSLLPLRLISFLGTLLTFVGCVMLIYILATFVFLGSSFADMTLILAVIIFLGGFQIMAIGIVGEYVGKAHKETKKRPHYVIESKEGFE